jgi:hypothetical protein
MKSFDIEDIKNFMNELLVQDKYDSFYLYEARIKTSLDYYINGRINRDFFDSQEEALEYAGEKASDSTSLDKLYVTWGNVRHSVYELIKGRRLPISFKLVLMFNRENIVRLVEMNNLPFSLDSISTLSMNIYYENGSLTVTTGTALNIFTMDKTLEQLWDETVEKYYV